MTVPRTRLTEMIYGLCPGCASASFLIWRAGLAGLALALTILAWCPAMAQVATDIARDGSLGALPAGPITDSGGGVFEVGESHGARPGGGGNLFHSFETFDLGGGHTALFTADFPTENVISRVTGGSSSDIYGTLRSHIAGADFYFLNPAGIFFGPGATLDIQGSFHASTGAYLEFEGGERFHASPSTPSLLTAAPPSAFGFLGNASIRVDGTALENPAGIELSAGRISVINGAQIDASNAWGGSEPPGSILLSASGKAEVSNSVVSANSYGSEGVGRVDILVEDLEVSDGGGISAWSYGSTQGGIVSVIADGQVIVSNPGFDEAGEGKSWISVEMFGSGGPGKLYIKAPLVIAGEGSTITSASWSTGTGGSLILDVGSLGVLDGGQVVSTAMAPGGAGGDIEINAKESVTVSGNGFVVFDLADQAGWNFDGIAAGAQEAAAGGSLSIDSPLISIVDGGTVAAAGLFGGRGGNLKLLGDRIEILRGGDVDSSTMSFDSSTMPGQAGDIMISATHSLEISDSSKNGIPSRIRAATGGLGDGGTISISAPEMTLDGGAINNGAAGLSEAFGNIPAGSPGDIIIDAHQLSVIGGGWIDSSTFGDNRGGDVTVHARDSITISGELSGIVSKTAAAGAGGSVHLEAGEIDISDGGVVSTESSAGFGAARRTIQDIIDSGLLAEPEEPVTGDAGVLTLEAGESVVIRSGSVTSGATGEGDAGTVAVVGPFVDLSEDAVVSSSATGTGAAGSIAIGPRTGSLHLSDSTISTYAVQGAEVGAGSEGNISILLDASLVMENGSTITASVERGLGGDVTIEAPELVLLLDESQILARTETGQGGRIDITTDVFLKSLDSEVSADAGAGVHGSVAIHSPEADLESNMTALTAEFLNAPALFRPTCAARGSGAREGSFVVAHRQGLPSSPEGLLLAFDAVGGGGEVSVAEEGEEDDLPPVASGPPIASAARAAELELAEAGMAFRGGKLEAAGQHWEKASALYGEGGDQGSRGDALRGLAQTQQAMGQYAESVETLRAALVIAEQSEDKARIASALASLGNAYVALGQPEMAEEMLTRGTGMAQEAGEVELSAAIWNNLGNHYASRRNFAKALEAYEESAARARESGDRVGEAKALSNAARAALDAGEPRRAPDLLQRADTRARSLADSREKVYVLIHVAKSFERMAGISQDRREESLLNANDALRSAMELAQEIGDQRALSYALGNLGSLYQSEHRVAEALYFTRRALRAAEQADAPESIYRWHWQAGQLLWAQGKANEAIRSYRRAVDILEETRQETLAHYGSAEVYFRQLVAPVYLDLVDALLQGSAMLTDAKQSEQLLVEARSTVEQLKAAELRDYFRDECVADLEARTRSPEAVSATAAVVYPILLPDRLDLLVTLPSGLERYTVPVGSAELTAEVRRLRNALQGLTRTYLPSSQRLYDWLVRPLEPDLEAAEIDTLVFVPDGALRTIPMAALHDGEGFLIQRYGIAVTPVLELVDPGPLERSKMNLLLAGISESVEGYPPLANVPAELEAVQSLYGGEVLLNQDFVLERMEREMREGEPSVVHIASHGQFTGDPATSFLLAYDGRLTMDRLSEYVGVAKFREDPLELLVLSACETAAGDDRAALGLAGLAIRAGARSAVGSLWPIGDEAASQLVTAFYRQLESPSVTKAQALQRAQLELIDSELFGHPRYWSPFLLISNWL